MYIATICVTRLSTIFRYGLTLHDGMHELRKCLDSMGLVKGLTSDEKDPEEFLNLLLDKTFATPPPIELRFVNRTYNIHVFKVFDLLRHME